MPQRRSADALLERLRQQLLRHLPMAHAVEAEALCTLSLPLPAPIGPAFPPRGEGPCWYWADHPRRRYRIGLGVVHTLTARGGRRFTTLRQGFDILLRRWRHLLPPGTPPSRPKAFVGFAFAGDDPMEGAWQGLPNTLLAIPELLLESAPAGAILHFTATGRALHQRAALIRRWLRQAERLLEVGTPSATLVAGAELERVAARPDDRRWLETVEQARRQMEDGGIRKVVLVRQVTVRGDSPIREAAVLQRLGTLEPACQQIALAMGGKSLVAATPERLVSFEDGTIRCDALGGTIGRSGEPGGDQLLARRLLADPKMRHEHALVVEALRETLIPLCRSLRIPEVPVIRRLHTLQHLWTPIEGEARDDASLIELAARVHPTPAVAGTPLEESLAWLRRHHPVPRGWYTGGVGWIDTAGEGELHVLLRCALLEEEQAHLFAGAGVVADSRAHEELLETELKLSTLLQALGGSAGMAEENRRARG